MTDPRIIWPSDEECRNYALSFYNSTESSTGFLSGTRWLRANVKLATHEDNKTSKAIEEYLDANPAMFWVSRDEIEKVKQSLARVPLNSDGNLEEAEAIVDGWLK